MDFPKDEAQALLDWMREQMYGDTVTEWTYGNEHDRMSGAADFWAVCFHGRAAIQNSADKDSSITSA